MSKKRLFRVHSVFVFIVVLMGLLGCSKPTNRFIEESSKPTSAMPEWVQVVETPRTAQDIDVNKAISIKLTDNNTLNVFPLDFYGQPAPMLASSLKVSVTNTTKAIANNPQSIVRNLGSQADFSLKIELTRNIKQTAIYFYIGYDQTQLHPVFANRLNASGNIAMLAILDIPGSAAVGFTTLGGDFMTSTELVEIGFKYGKGNYRNNSAAATALANAVTINAAKGEASGTVTLSWKEINKGDCNNNGVVDFADFGVIGMHYNKTSANLTPDQLFLVDGNGNGKVDFADFGVVGANYNATISGYQILRILAVQGGSYTVDDFLDNKQPKVGVDVLPNLGDPPINNNISIDRSKTVPKDAPVIYTYVDKPPTGGFYAYMVRPYSSAKDAQPWGTPSKITVAEVQATALVFETDKLVYDSSVDKEVLLKVKLMQAKDVFSVNFRFSYEPMLLKLVSISKTDGVNGNFFKDTVDEPLLFFGTEVDPLNLGTIAVNATLPGTIPDPTVKDGVIAYIKFEIIPGNTGQAKFIFPAAQAGSFIYIKTKVGAQLEDIPPFTIGNPLEINIK